MSSVRGREQVRLLKLLDPQILRKIASAVIRTRKITGSGFDKEMRGTGLFSFIRKAISTAVGKAFPILKAVTKFAIKQVVVPLIISKIGGGAHRPRATKRRTPARRRPAARGRKKKAPARRLRR